MNTKLDVTRLIKVTGVTVWLTDNRNGDMSLNVNMTDDGELVGTVIIMAGRPVRAWTLDDVAFREYDNVTDAVGYLRDAARLKRETLA